MAIYKVVNEPENYRSAQDVQQVIAYATSPDKVSQNGVFGGAVLPENASEAMECVIAVYHNEGGLCLRHSVLSFSPEDSISLEQAKEIAPECISYYEDEFQILAAVHEDTDHPHIHIVMNTTNYNDGSKYRGTKADYYGFLRHIDEVLRPYGTHVCPAK